MPRYYIKQAKFALNDSELLHQLSDFYNALDLNYYWVWQNLGWSNEEVIEPTPLG